MELPGCYAMTETGHGSNVQALRTTATYDPDTQEFVVNTPDDDARKDYIGNAARDGRLAVVFAQLDHGRGGARRARAARADPRRAAASRATACGSRTAARSSGLNGVDNGRLWFDQVRVPRENLLDKLAQVHEDGTYFSAIENPTRRFFTMLGTLIQGRISVGGASISASKVALTIAVRRALERRQFGAPGAEQEALLMDYRTHQRRLLIPLAKTYALSFTQNRLVQDLHAVFTDEDTPERERRELETLAAGVKAIATWHATDTIQGCREACGGAGYLRSSRFASLKADTDVFTTFEGDNTILLQLAAKNLLTDYKDAFGDLDKLGMAQFVAGQALSVLGERVPLRKLADSLRPGRDDDADLLDPKTQLDLFRWRHEHLLQGAARRLKGGIDAKRDPFDVLVDTQDHVLEVARSWVDLVILESFVEGAKGNALLGKLCTLYALQRDRDRARLLPGARAAVGRALEGRRQGRQHAVRGAAPRCARARGRVRRAGDRARRRPRGGRGAGAGAGVRTRLPRAEREQQTLDQARALFAAHGYAAVTMDQVAAAVGVTKPLLYNYFGNKEQLFLACMKPAADALTEHVVSAVRTLRTRPRRCATASTRSSPSSTATRTRGGCCTTTRCRRAARSPRG